jgi:hypothetical protein
LQALSRRPPVPRPAARAGARAWPPSCRLKSSPSVNAGGVLGSARCASPQWERPAIRLRGRSSQRASSRRPPTEPQPAAGGRPAASRLPSDSSTRRQSRGVDCADFRVI